jgi:hypothetical protein
MTKFMIYTPTHQVVRLTGRDNGWWKSNPKTASRCGERSTPTALEQSPPSSSRSTSWRTGHRPPSGQFGACEMTDKPCICMAYIHSHIAGVGKCQMPHWCGERSPYWEDCAAPEDTFCFSHAEGAEHDSYNPWSEALTAAERNIGARL